MVNVLFFAQLKEQLDEGNIQLSLLPAHDTPLTVNTVIQKLIELDSKFEMLRQPHLFVAVNQQISQRDTLIDENDEVAFFPAVTGG